MSADFFYFLAIECCFKRFLEFKIEVVGYKIKSALQRKLFLVF